MGEKIEQEISFSELPELEAANPGIVTRVLQRKTQMELEEHGKQPTPVDLLQSGVATTYIDSYKKTEQRLFSTCNFVDWSAHTIHWTLEQKLAFLQKVVRSHEEYAASVRLQALYILDHDTDVPALTHIGLLDASSFWDTYLTNETTRTTATAFGENRLREIDDRLKKQAASHDLEECM